MVCGFSKPVFGLLPLVAVIPLLPSRMLAVAWFVGLVVMMIVGEWHSRFRARRQVATWCSRYGFSAPRWKRRSGFVSWGCSVWSFCEILTCSFEDHSGATFEVLVDVCAPAFGFWVKSQVLVDANTVFDPVAPEQ